MDKNRYIGRKEFFGSLLFDRLSNEYIPFDNEQTSFFINGKFRDPLNMYEMKKFAGFENLCKELNVVDENGKFIHKWIDNQTIEHILSAPLKLSLNITSGCNLACKHCYSCSKNGNHKEMNIEKVKMLMDRMAELGLQSLSIKGGEPFHHSSFMDVLHYAKEKSISVTIITNGLLIDEHIAGELNNTSVHYITVSIDGGQEKTHDYIRGKGTFQEVLKKLELLKKYFHHPLFVYFTLNKLNIKEIPQVFSIAQDVKCDGLRFRPVLPIGRSSLHEEINLTGEEYRKAMKEVKDCSRISDIKIDIPDSELNKDDIINRELYNFGCVAGNTFAHMDPYGNLYPCQYLENPEFLAGNIFTSSFKDIWDNSPIFNTFRNLPGNSTCGNCKFFSSCRGGCRARAIFLSKDINMADPWCMINT